MASSASERPEEENAENGPSTIKFSLQSYYWLGIEL